MPHPVITGATVAYRTKLMALDQAQSFARCLKANSRFKSVLVNTSARAISAKRYYVTFEPANAERERDLLAAQQSDREKRAHEGGMIFLQHDRYHWMYHCFSIHSQETYDVSLRDCSCPDAQVRTKKLGIQCKHQIALGLWLEEQKKEMR